ncbi:MAG TPA: divergent polysaccharide deacetylase family protein [Alphaproteobacteria bacterium]|nr:hypothetical protein [Rhodospirillaceae bacterium]HRJ11952.1 divergent polysaccharide deacetylase family protein [Alphaproteobacteria bacterium]
MLLRYGPFALIWLIGGAFLLWLIIAPRIADPRYWQVDAVDIKLGSTAVFNQYDENKNTMNDAANNPSQTPEQAVPQTEDPGLAPLSALADDGVRINALNPDLQEDGTHGPIPKKLGDRAPWQYYARPFPADDARPRIAIVVKDMGLSDSGLKDSLLTLPGPVSFAFSPYADNLSHAMQSARDRGHETLLQLPLEVPPGAIVDVGTQAISSAQTAAVNQDNLFKLLAHMPGSVGVITEGGQRLANNESMLKPLMENLWGRGLLMIDDTQQNETLSPLFAEQLKMPWARSLLRVDEILTRNAIDEAMKKAVALAKENGRAVVVTGASPLARSMIANWTPRLEREGIALAPVSAVVTLGSAGQVSLPEQQLAPNVMTEETEDDTATPTAAEPETGPINLLNPGTNVPNILDPAKPAQP